MAIILLLSYLSAFYNESFIFKEKSLIYSKGIIPFIFKKTYLYNDIESIIFSSYKQVNLSSKFSFNKIFGSNLNSKILIRLNSGKEIYLDYSNYQNRLELKETAKTIASTTNINLEIYE